MKRLFSARPFAHQTLGVFLLVTLLIVAGCGGGEATPEPAIAPTSTLIPTLPPPPTPVPAEATAIPEAVATEAPAATEATAGVTATEEITTTEETTATEPVSETAEVTETEAVTATEEITATEAATATAEATATEEVTATREMTEGQTPGEAITETESVSPSAEITGSEAVSGFAVASNVNVFFLQPTTNAIVPITFTVEISAEGENVDAGYIHLLIDSDFIEPGQPIPDDESHYHFDDGSTSAELSLGAGSHILRLQFADSNHLALEGEQYRQEIIVNVIDGAPKQAVRIVSPSAGAIVPPTFNVVLAATGLTVEPAGAVNEGSGHLHLLIDEPYIAEGETIPADETHIHLGKGQLTTTLTLEPGTYLLRLQFADGAHVALAGDQYRAEAQIVVAEDAPAEQVMFIKPGDGATVTSPFLVGWAASGLIIETAGKVIRPDGGHLHVLVDEDFVAAGEVIPMDETHFHFGKAQTSAELTLEPGEHTLRLQMANGGHIAQDGEEYQDEITVTVR